MYFVCQFFIFSQTNSEQSGAQFSTLCTQDVQLSYISNHFLFYSQIAGQKHRLYE